MFEDKLAETFQKIFGVKKVTFDAPSFGSAADAVKEQETLFIEIEMAPIKILDKQQVAKVTGNGMMIGKSDKIPFGFFSKAIAAAPSALTKDLFFFEFEDNKARHRDIVQRGFSFVYFFRSQYDPDAGNITSIDINVEEH